MIFRVDHMSGNPSVIHKSVQRSQRQTCRRKRISIFGKEICSSEQEPNRLDTVTMPVEAQYIQ